MGLSGSKQQQQSNNQSTTTWGQVTPNETEDTRRLRDQKFEVDPGLAHQYAQQRQNLHSGFNNPTGAYYSPQVRDAIVRAGDERLGEQEAQAFREGQSDVNRLNFARNSTVAAMTAPKIVQTGLTSSGSGTITQSQSPWGAILQGGASLGSASL
jgi:hypothetical protein